MGRKGARVEFGGNGEAGKKESTVERREAARGGRGRWRDREWDWMYQTD